MVYCSIDCAEYLYWSDGRKAKLAFDFNEVETASSLMCMRTKNVGGLVRLGDMACNTLQATLCQYDCNKIDTGDYFIHVCYT